MSSPSQTAPASDDKLAEVDVILAAYNEPLEAVVRSVQACLYQTHEVRRVLVIDNGSTDPVTLPDALANHPRVRLIRVSENHGRPGAINNGLRHTDAPFVLCLNCEVEPLQNWVETCVRYLQAHPQVGACCSRIVCSRETDLTTQWRRRMLEYRYEFEEGSGPVDSCIGHAVLFRTQPLKDIGGFDERYFIVYDDPDVCYRLRDIGYESHVVAGTYVLYTQEDTIDLLAQKVLRNCGWALTDRQATNPVMRPVSFPKVFTDQTYWLLHRLMRNGLTLRLPFLVIDVQVWLRALQQAWDARDNVSSPPPEPDSTPRLAFSPKQTS